MPSLPTFESIASALDVSMDSLKGGKAENTEYRFVSSLMELNKLTAEKRDAFIEFLSVNIKYFR